MRRSCHEKSRQGTDLSPRTVRESARRGVAGGAFSVIVQTLGTCLGRFGPPRPPWWPETASPRKQRPNSGVEAEIRPLGAHFLATSRLRQKPVYPPPPRHEKTLLAPTGRRGGELAPRGGGWRPCRGFRGGRSLGPSEDAAKGPRTPNFPGRWWRYFKQDSQAAPGSKGLRASIRPRQALRTAASAPPTSRGGQLTATRTAASKVCPGIPRKVSQQCSGTCLAWPQQDSWKAFRGIPEGVVVALVLVAAI